MKTNSKFLLGTAVVILLFAIAAGAAIDHWRAEKGQKRGQDSGSLPQFGELLPSSDEAEVKGKAYCGNCYWGVGEAPDNVVLKTSAAPGIVFLSPNEKVSEIEKITGKCADGTVMIKAHGIVSRHDGHNYLFVRDFETVTRK